MAFVRDVTEDILKKGVYSNRGIKKACQFHIQQKSKDLDKDKMQQMLDQLLSHLCISSDDSFDDVDFGFGGSSCSKNNLKWCIPLERKEKFNGDERPFFQLEEHSQLNVEESSCQSGRSKENSYVEVSDQDNSDHSLSSQTSNLGNKLTEENKDDDDTVASSPCSSGSKHVLSRTSTVNDKYSSSVCSDNYTSQLS
ncbi:spermatogenesis-associated protein 7-like [Limulus polyphemus]|uniref:Spermatogenesis-associated protein 7-like n=1 Tax=Limulus polyphemus TaxID=6850 RepID=A0ABM1TSI6_LIMPO|nr:spermatogenesis-associated protein 7-like [Limulus polyphemus]